MKKTSISILTVALLLLDVIMAQLSRQKFDVFIMN